MISKIKIPAFTLTEMLLVLAISAIIAGLSFGILTLFNKNLQMIENNYNEGTNRSLFVSRLTVDFNRYHNINYDAIGKKLLMKNALDSISYVWEEHWVLRDEDTVMGGPTAVTVYFGGDEIDFGNMDALKVNFGEVDKNNFIFISQVRDAFTHIEKNGD